MDADVVVVGAGAAGLAAAHKLAKKKSRVLLLEARDRVGGRVWSCPTSPDGPRVELGAEFIHGDATDTMAVLRDAGVQALATAGDAWLCSSSGELQRDDETDFFSSAAIFEDALSLPQDETIDKFLQRFAHDPAMREKMATARAFAEGFDAADPSIASAQAIADEWCSGVDFTSRRPVGGYHRMFECLRSACLQAGVELFESTAAERITWRRGDVTVHATMSNGRSRDFAAQTAVITLPAGVLKQRGGEGDVIFEPELPAEKRDALRYIEMGEVRKVTLWFETPFWERLRAGRYRDAGFFRCEDDAFAVYWAQLPLRTTLITAWAGGPKAVALRDVSNQDVIDRALFGFGNLFHEAPLAKEQFKGGFTHDWAHDGYARGAYTYIAVGGRKARATLAAPIAETLFFAGEATAGDGQGGTVSGALNTGERAAQEAAAALAKKRAR